MYMSTEITIQQMELRLSEIHMRPKGNSRHNKEQKDREENSEKKKRAERQPKKLCLSGL